MFFQSITLRFYAHLQRCFADTEGALLPMGMYTVYLAICQLTGKIAGEGRKNLCENLI